MKILPTQLAEILVLDPEVYGDERGYLLEQYQETRYGELGMGRIIQINHSHSRKGTIRGLHFQEPKPQGKLVWCARGAIFDVAVDVRRGSPTFGQWASAELSEDNHRQMWIPVGFAHGFCVLSEQADCYYGCTGPYAPEHAHAVSWNDPDIGIAWPTEQPLLSPKDAAAPRLRELQALPHY